MRVVNIGGACLLVAVLGSACGAPGEGVPAAGKQRAGLTTPMKLHAAQASVADAWTRIDLPQSYTSMVVVATAEYAASSAPVTARIRNATGSSFELRVQRVDGGTAALPELPVSYLVAEAGIYSASSGLKMEAVTFDSTVTDRKGSFSGQRRSYRQAYVSPVVLGQVQTANDAWPSLFWSRGSSRSVPPDSVLRVGKHVGEDTRSRADETLGYVIVEAGSGALSGASWQAGVTPLSVRGVAGDAPFAQSLASPGPASFAVASQTGMNNADGSFALLAGPAAATGSSLRLGVDEDNWGDGERNHGAERVAFFALNPCPSPEAVGQACGASGACRADQTCCPDADSDGACDDVDVCAGFPDGADDDGDGKADGCDRDVADCRAGMVRPGVLTGDQRVDATNVETALPGLRDVWCIVGHLDVRGTSLGSLDGLRNLVAVTGRLGLYQNAELESLGGLDALRKVGLLDVSEQSALTSLAGAPVLTEAGSLMLSFNPRLTSLAGLDQLATVGAVFISQNDGLETLDGLGPITRTNGTFSLANNPLLTDVSALASLSDVGLDLWLIGNGALASLDGLENLTRVGRTLRISQHASLSSIDALGPLAAVGDHLELFGNPELDECAVAELAARVQRSCTNCSGNLGCSGQLECSANACVDGACGTIPAPAGSPCSAGICDAAGACVSPVRLEVTRVKDASIHNPPQTQDGVWNPGDEIGLDVAVFNDGETPLTQVSSVRIVTQDGNVSRVFPYPIFNNAVPAHGRGNAFPDLMIANDAPLGAVVAVVVEVDYLRDGNAETLRVPQTLVVGPGTPAPGVPVSLELVRMSDGHFLNTNRDGRFAPGEVISINTRARNWLRATATPAIAFVTTTDPFVSATGGGGLTPPPSNSLGPADTKLLSSTVTLSPATPVGRPIEFTIHLPYQLDGQSGVASIPLSFVVSAP